MTFQIFDTREPEGDGGAVVNDTGEPLEFDTHDDAVVAARKLFGEHDVLRVRIAPEVLRYS